VHHEVLIAVRDVPSVPGRFPIGRLAERPQEVGVAAEQRLAHRRVGRENLALLEVLGRSIDVGLGPGIGL